PTRRASTLVLLRQPQQFRPVSAPRPAMAHGPQSTVVRDAQTLGVIQHLAVVQLALFLDLREKLFPPNLPAVEILIPLEQIFDRRMHRAIASLLEVGNIQAVTYAFLL